MGMGNTRCTEGGRLLFVLPGPWAMGKEGNVEDSE